MTNAEKIEKLTEETKALLNLLEQNEQGIGTWWECVYKRIDNICILQYGFLPFSMPE